MPRKTQQHTQPKAATADLISQIAADSKKAMGLNKTLSAALEENKRTILKLNDELEVLREKTAELAPDETARALTGQLMEKEAIIQRLDADLSFLKQRSIKKSIILEKLDKRLQKFYDTINLKNALIQELAKNLESHQRMAEARERQFEKLIAKAHLLPKFVEGIGRLKENLAFRNAEIGRLIRALREKDAEIAALQKSAGSLTDEREALVKAVEEGRADRLAMQNRLMNVAEVGEKAAAMLEVLKAKLVAKELEMLDGKKLLRDEQAATAAAEVRLKEAGAKLAEMSSYLDAHDEIVADYKERLKVQEELAAAVRDQVKGRDARIAELERAKQELGRNQEVLAKDLLTKGKYLWMLKRQLLNKNKVLERFKTDLVVQQEKGRLVAESGAGIASQLAEAKRALSETQARAAEARQTLAAREQAYLHIIQENKERHEARIRRIIEDHTKQQLDLKTKIEVLSNVVQKLRDRLLIAEASRGAPMPAALRPIGPLPGSPVPRAEAEQGPPDGERMAGMPSPARDILPIRGKPASPAPAPEGQGDRFELHLTDDEQVEEMVPLIRIALEHMDSPEQIRHSLANSGYHHENIEKALKEAIH
ncbi:hypothetical protein JXB02_03590 [Candidatus Woesearchaeota archaeon]|nr:hypothetical protein [Candidatus Woesearchaeota archaeon]